MRMAFLDAMRMWERDTCLYFEYVSEEETDFLYLKKGNTYVRPFSFLCSTVHIEITDLVHIN